jgi:Tfp pilus assembly protein PilV
VRVVSYQKRPGATDNGFALLEALVAACLLAGAIASLVHVFVFATRAHAETQYATYATVLATQKVEELRATSLPADVADAADYADALGAVLPDGADPLRGIYERRWTVQTFPSTLDSVVISVTVTRRDGLRGGGVRLVTLQRRRHPVTDISPETPGG